MRGRSTALFLLLLATAAHAQTSYITDRTLVELRRGPSLEYLILRSLEAGTAVQVLEQDADSGYSRVRVQDQGTEGWVLTRFLTAEPIARDRLAAAERSLAAAKARTTDLEQRVTSLTAELNATKSDLDKTRTNHEQVSKDLADLRTASANVVEIRDQNESLRQRLIQREREVEELTAANARLGSQDRQNWFIVGAGVLLGGIIVGLIAPSLRRKRRSDW
jgi:SH3 domain protein